MPEKSNGKKRYAQVGIGGRSRMYTDAMVGDFAEHCELVAFCDRNQGRMELRNREIADRHRPVTTYPAEQFDKMVAETKPDVVVVTTGPDRTHSEYICRALKLGCDVVTEKPMTVDEQSCREILRTVDETGRRLQVTFNYRYAPPRSQVRELIQDGQIGQILSVDFAWVLDTKHGADYFRRWHSRRENSGSLLVHKSTHHFDLVNWWLDDIPEEVFAHGSRRFYTPENAKARGLEGHGERCLDCPVKDKCDFYLDLAGNERLKELYLDNEQYDGYIRDKCVFRDEIDIWDNMSVAVRYKGGALLNYMLHAYSPYEGYRIAFNGTGGRIEHHACERTYISGDGTIPGELEQRNVSVTLIKEFSQPVSLEPRTGKGGHGGGDNPLLMDVFHPNPPADPLRRKASQKDGAYSILVGVAAYHSIDTGLPVQIADLLGDAPLGE